MIEEKFIQPMLGLGISISQFVEVEVQSVIKGYLFHKCWV